MGSFRVCLLCVLSGCGSAPAAVDVRPVARSDDEAVPVVALVASARVPAATAGDADSSPPRPLPADPSRLDALLPKSERTLSSPGLSLVRFASAMVGVQIAPDVGSAVLVPFGRGAMLRTPAGTRSLDVDGEVTRSQIAPNSRFAVLETTDGTTHAFALPGGELRRRIEGRHARFDGQSRLWVQGEDCRLARVDLATREALSWQGGWCDGRMTDAAVEEGLGLVVRSAAYRLGLFQAYVAADLYAFASRTSKTVLEGDADHPFFMPRLTPTAGHLVYFDARFGLHALDLRGGRDAVLWPEGALRDPVADSGGTRLLFETGASDHGSHELWVASLDGTDRRRLLAATQHESWTFLPGNARAVGHGGTGGFTVVEIDGDRRWRWAASDEEWEGMALVPGHDHLVVLGRERDAVRDLYLVRLDGDAPPASRPGR
ncbi:MAG: hypothetical protein AAF928_08990 [Myxococcota bacterium]